jgi:two-component system cell cycle response regulator
VSSTEAKPVVLIIDDSQDVHRLVEARLRHESVTFASALSGREGLQLAQSLRPALILLDLDMPDLDGYAVLRELKNSSETATIPVLVLSGMTRSTDKVAAFDLGAVDYVTKPFDFMELRARLRSVLRTQELIRLLAERAEIDALTGVGNRAQFNRRWREEVAEAARHARPLTLAVLDIDHFKRINDTYGHPAGDEVIATLARVIQRCVRVSDVVCRYGGEEFAVILPTTTPDDAEVVAQRIRESLQARVWPRHPEHTVTCSIGLAGSVDSREGMTPEAWFEAADAALYTAKQSGRNRVVCGALKGAAKVRAAG